ncbi:MAG: PilZ domain-containing protein [Candidatus Zixiibacteriota bacterium]
MEERRELKRKLTSDFYKVKGRSLEEYLEVFDCGSNQSLGRLVDITIKGIMLISETPVEIDKSFQLRINLAEIIDGKKEITFDAKSIWCNKENDSELYNTGFQIEKIAPVHAEGRHG